MIGDLKDIQTGALTTTAMTRNTTINHYRLQNPTKEYNFLLHET